MQITWKSITQSIAIAAGLLFLAAASRANATSSVSSTGTLTVSATVSSTLQLVFGSNNSGVTLSGISNNLNNNSATLGFGGISAYGTPPAGVTITQSGGSLCSSCFVASTPMQITVNAANTSSATFTLAAYASAPTNGESLSVGSSIGTALGTSSPGTTITATGSYGGGGVTENVYLGIPLASDGATDNASFSTSDTITFVATAN